MSSISTIHNNIFCRYNKIISCNYLYSKYNDEFPMVGNIFNNRDNLEYVISLAIKYEKDINLLFNNIDLCMKFINIIKDHYDMYDNNREQIDFYYERLFTNIKLNYISKLSIDEINYTPYYVANKFNNSEYILYPSIFEQDDDHIENKIINIIKIFEQELDINLLNHTSQYPKYIACRSYIISIQNRK